MTLKSIVATILIFFGFIAYAIGLVKMCTAITVVALCGGTAIALVGFALVAIGGFMTF